MRRPFRLLMSAMMVAAFVGSTACSENNSDPGNNQRRMVSSENFNIGRTDGRRDAKNSWNDSGSYWLWLWAAEESYQTGYEQGWKEGRAEAKNEEASERSRREREEQENERSSE